jgi:hypothetical protein
MKRTDRKKSRTDRPTLPELDQTKKSVLNSLASLQSRRSYQHAITIQKSGHFKHHMNVLRDRYLR